MVTPLVLDPVGAVAQQYLAAWNERDTLARRAQVAPLFKLDAEYLAPTMRGAGHDGIDAMIAGAQQHFPGHRPTVALRLSGRVLKPAYFRRDKS